MKLVVIGDQLPALLEGILRTMPNLLKVHKPGEQTAVKRILALEYESRKRVARARPSVSRPTNA